MNIFGIGLPEMAVIFHDRPIGIRPKNYPKSAGVWERQFGAFKTLRGILSRSSRGKPSS